MSAIKLSGKPEGATHYSTYSGCVNWYKLSGQQWSFRFCDSWHVLDSPVPQQNVIEIVDDPQAAASEQLPAIGSSCEFWIANGRWDPCRVVAHDVLDGVPVAVVAYAGGYYGASIKTLRASQ